MILRGVGRELRHALKRAPWRIVLCVAASALVIHTWCRNCTPDTKQAIRDAFDWLADLFIALWIQRLGHGWLLRRKERNEKPETREGDA